MGRLSGQAVQNHDVFQGGDAFPSYSRSPLSHNASSKAEELTKAVKADEIGCGAKVPNDGNQFHFSMHKWANKGVPLVMSLDKRNSFTSKEKNKLERSLSLNGSVELESDPLVGEIRPAHTNTDGSLSFNVHVVATAKERKESDQIVDKSVTDALKLRPNNKVENMNSAVSVSYFSGVREGPVFPKNSTFTEAELSKPDSDANKSDLKQSSAKLDGADNRTPEVRGNLKVVKGKRATSVDVDNAASHEEVEQSKLKEPSGFKGDKERDNINHQKNTANDMARRKDKEKMENDRIREKAKDGMGSNGATGKVKDLVKIFNQEPASKLTTDVNGKRPTRRWRNTDLPRANSKSKLSSTKTDEKMQGFDVNWNLDSSPKVDENHTTSDGKQLHGNNNQEPDQSSSTKNENLGLNMGLASNGSKASSTNIDDIYESILIEELPPILDKSPEDSENHEDIHILQSKIVKWSKEKEGNIRAILSTLQYVLWPNSGWKPVPLVDIIEPNAVKRSYQRAMLCLHPDKLQQKGAAFHQKFIAEKVLDILQEAWDQFNTFGSL